MLITGSPTHPVVSARKPVLINSGRKISAHANPAMIAQIRFAGWKTWKKHQRIKPLRTAAAVFWAKERTDLLGD